MKLTKEREKKNMKNRQKCRSLSPAEDENQPERDITHSTEHTQSIKIERQS